MSRLLVGLAMMIGLIVATQPIVVAAAGNTYTVGVVPQFEPRKLHGIWRPILDEIEERTGHTFVLQGSQTIPEFEREFIAGLFDFAYMNPYHLVMANDSAGYRPIVRDHGRMLHGILVVPRASAIRSPEELDGKVVAFPAPNALGASLKMRQELADLFGVKVRPRYVKTHDSVYIHVLLGESAAGGGVQKTLNRQKPEYREALRVIHRTRDVAPHPLAVLPAVPEEVAEAVRRAFMELGESESGRSLLARIPVKRIGPASIDDYAPLRKLDLERFYEAPH